MENLKSAMVVDGKGDLEKALRKINTKIAKIQDKLKNESHTDKKTNLRNQIYALVIQKAELYFQNDSYKEAMELYKSLPLNPLGECRYEGITKILIETEKFDDAKQLLEEGIKKYPESYSLLNSKGLLCYKTKDYYEALRHLDHSIAINPENNPWSLYNKARVLISLEYYEEANKLLHELIERVPDEPLYLDEIAYCNLQRGDLWAAINYYRTILDMDYESSSVYAGIGCAYISAGLIYEAFGVTNRGLTKYPDGNPVLYENLTELYIEFDDLKNAGDTIRKGLNIYQDYEPLLELQRKVEGKGRKIRAEIK
ncbi:MAG: tetratricopeptide repeat protein [Nitrospira sp.]|nr:tetratricopeptide repeat protein [Nitrospira sp.]